MKYYIGIDIGTSSVKVTLIDKNGRITKETSREYDIEEPKSGWKQIDPEVWMRGTDEAMVRLLEGCDPQEVDAIGVTGQMHTVVFLDENGVSIRPALMWNDTRTKDMVSNLKEKILKLPKASHIANIISTGSPAVNLLWLKENEPDSFHRMKKFLIGPDYIVYRLTGTMQTDYCEASTSSLCDLTTGKWSPEIRRLLDFPESIYPEIRGTAAAAGTVLEKWSRKYGFHKNVKVIVGTGDNPAAAIATGCFSGKYPVLSLGTSGVLMVPKDKIDFKAKGKNILFSMDGEEISILVQGVIQSTGSSLGWWVKQVLKTDDFAEETEAEDTEHLGESPLIFYPHLAGDKTIYADPNLRGMFIGLGTDTTRKEMTLAVMEGICLAARQLSEVMCLTKEELKGLKVTGGGSKNQVWMQMLADVLGTEVQQMESGAGAGYGIALAAAGSQGEISMEQILHHTIKIKKTFSPRAYNQGLYEGKYQKYKKIYRCYQEIMSEE